MKVRKVSLTLPSDLLDEARSYLAGGNLSAYVPDGLRRRVLSDRLGRYLRELDAECGPLTEQEIARIRPSARDTLRCARRPDRAAPGHDRHYRRQGHRSRG